MGTQSKIQNQKSKIPRPTWLEIDRSALVNNVAQLRRIIGPNRLLMGVVKANGYGHGVVEVARITGEAGVDCFAVASGSEGVELRAAGISAPILVLGFTPDWLAEESVARDLTTTVYDIETGLALHQSAIRLGKRAKVHVKVNTGMNRLGVNLADALGLLAALADLPNLDVEGIFTHFSASDLTDKSMTILQFDRFTALLDELTRSGLRPPIAHAANSAALLTLPQTHLDMARSGIALYGLHPDDPETLLPAGFRPALSWKAVVAQVRQIPTGEGVSYGHEWVAPRPSTIAIIPVGYADGFPRRPLTWGSVLVHGQIAPIRGRVCMDQTLIDVTDIAAARPVRQGDEVVIIGRQGDLEISAEAAGRRIGSINYDVVSRILARVPRVVS